MVYLLALGASLANALTSILQRMGVQDAPDDLRLRLRLLGYALRHRVWLLGFLLMSYGLAAVIGPPVAGLLVDRSGHYRDVIWLALLASLAGVVVSLLLRNAQYAPETEASEAAA